MVESDESTPEDPSYTIGRDILASVVPEKVQDYPVYLGDGDWSFKTDPNFVPYPFSQFPFETFSPLNFSLPISMAPAKVDDENRGSVRSVTEGSALIFHTGDLPAVVPDMTEETFLQDKCGLPLVNVVGSAGKEDIRHVLYKSWLRSSAIRFLSIITLLSRRGGRRRSMMLKTKEVTTPLLKCGKFDVPTAHFLLRSIG